MKRAPDEPLRVPLLSPAECRRVSEGIYALRRLWTARPTEGHPEWLFHTLGASSSHEIRSGGREALFLKARRINPVLFETFGWLYQRMAAVVEEKVNRTVYYDGRLGLPGFLIFPEYQDFRGAEHTDSQFVYLQWDEKKYGKIDFSAQISLTLPITIPPAGAGLHYWDVDLFQWQKMPEQERAKVLERQPQYASYRAGSLLLHNGLRWHRASVNPGGQEEPRITLQGFMLPTRKGWVIYW